MGNDEINAKGEEETDDGMKEKWMRGPRYEGSKNGGSREGQEV